MRYRRTALQARVPLPTGCIALVIVSGSLGMAPALAAHPAQLGCWLVCTGTLAQTGGDKASRQQAEQLLREARSAIKSADFARAETLIAEAEKLNVHYDPLTQRFVDTPDKLRKLLAEERSRSTASRGGMRLPALLGGKPAEPPPATSVPADPTSTASSPATPPAAAASSVAEQLTGDVKSKAAALLHDARAALARGDKLAALAAWQKAAGLGATFSPNEDSPQRLADDLVAAGIDPARLVPVPSQPGSPYALRPSDVAGSAAALPQLATPGTSPPAAMAPQPATPYNLPPQAQPLPVAATPGPDGPGSLPAPGALPPGTAAPLTRLPVGDGQAKAEASRLVAQARLALERGELETAARLAEQAEALNVPDAAFAPGETRPWQITLEVNRAMVRRGGVTRASGGATGTEPKYPVAQGVYQPSADPTQVVPASAVQPVQPQAAPAAGSSGPGWQLYQEGLLALQQQDRALALQKFTEAWRYQEQLDPETRQQLKDKLTLLRTGAATAAAPGEPSPLEQVQSQQELVRQKLVREILNEERLARQQAESDPKQALANVQKLRERVAMAEVEPAAKKQLLTMVDRLIQELNTYIEQNKATLENAERNAQIKAEIVRSQEVRLQTQTKLAEMVEEFNKLMDEARYAEAEVIARQARDIAPSEPVVVNMVEKARLAKAIREQDSLRERKEAGFLASLAAVEESSIAFDDRNPLVFGDVRRWADLTKSRRGWLEQQRRLSPVEQEIQRSLSKPVEARFINRPLSEVMDTLGRMAGVNVYLDPQGLNAEGVTTDTPVTLNLTQPISLKSALNLVLSPLGLSYVIQNEVLRITSEQTRDSNVYAKAYYVADLVMPIPNFLPSNNLALPGAIRDSLQALGMGVAPRPWITGGLTIAKNEGQAQPQTAVEAMAPMLAQMLQAPGGTPPNFRNAGQTGPGGWTGGTGPDFDSLIELITTTIAPQSWQEVGGPGAISGYENNLSLVVSQTQEVHEQIADLLEQLRRLQDLQVTIEVRFITLADNFFERIGVDFDVSIDDNTNLNEQFAFLPTVRNNIPTAMSPQFDDSNKSISIGWSATGPTGDLDVKLTQGSFASATPQFGGFDANTAAQFGFAILSDIEAFFLLEAAQGDTRANILQAPKVTLFNGQFANVTDTTIRPFVTSVIPVVGDFAVAQMPVIVVLTDGMSLSVQAVVSSDRRFVRLTLVPFFSQIREVQEFTFTGTTTTDSGTTVQDPTNPNQNVVNNQTRTVSGTTVQLPVQAVTSVNTTVSVPDGGTVLLGGVKRLREGRTERGVPILSKVPWVSRLFKNVGIGREAQSLMMMVSPRIIIQEEEEAKLGIEVAP
jgi:general secretion pathway protein D